MVSGAIASAMRGAGVLASADSASVRAAAEQAAPGLAMRAGPLSPSSSLYGSVDEYFSDVFPQIAISVGGSLVEMLDTRAAAA